MLEIEELIGLSEDMARAWAPALYMGMGRHTSYGYPEDWDAELGRSVISEGCSQLTGALE